MYIFSPEKSMPPLVAARMLRYAQFLSGFSYNIVCKRLRENTNANYFLRNPTQSGHVVEFDPDQELTTATINWIMPEEVDADVIRQETKNDQELQSIIKQIENGKNGSQFSLENGIVFRGHRVMIPGKLQTAVLRELHATHVGVSKMKELARACCHWSTINKFIEAMCRNCQACNDVKNNPKKGEIHLWEVTSKPWARLHVDFASPFLGYHFLILVDSYSK